LTSSDFGHVQKIICSALNTLGTAIILCEKNMLRFCPMRTFNHITTASIYLLKGLSLGVSPAKLQDALKVLQQTIAALKCSNPDDLHVGGRYGILLEMHLARLQKHFVPTLKPYEISSFDADLPQERESGRADGATTYDFMDCMDEMEGQGLNDSWLSLPLDTSLLSFDMDNFQGLQCLEDDTLNFLWNLGT
jgi:hypothetical protein